MLATKLWAIREGIGLATERAYTPFVVEANSRISINYLNGGLGCLLVEGLIVDDLLWMAGYMSWMKWSFFPRAANEAAHNLAKLSLENNDQIICVTTFPNNIRHLIRQDIVSVSTCTRLLICMVTLWWFINKRFTL